MPARWVLFKIICSLQIIATFWAGTTHLISFFRQFSFSGFAGFVVYLLSLLLAMMALQLLSTNYPAQPVAGRQKNYFNILFMLNFLLLAFHFAFFFSELQSLKNFAGIVNRRILSLPVSLLYDFGTNIVILVFQLSILYGLFVLRRLLYRNFSHSSFEFEKAT